ncbi:cytochrome c oxidase subunit II [Roseovarius pelagicus]|uniref:Cytochrome B n=1 Tax=Roseovarius pelagicus TaxID=2980108 RepID=A0ABY6DF35_9RHOB|nr:cytochrome B [Roseovarius pelagicus]UXX84766.1 cytochrome B [Roseovarius pelagicus]
MSILDPAGPAAASISRLWWVMFAGSAAILCLVSVLLVLSFRKRPPVQDERGLERTWIVGLGLVFTMGVLVALLAYGIVAGQRLTARAQDGAVEVSAVADRTGWRFGYGDRPGETTRNVLHIPAGRAVHVAITTDDVIHSFWVPRLAGKLDAIPGHVNTLKLEADEPGLYAGRSAEFSGPGYSRHRFEIRAHDDAAWHAFLREGAP